MITRFALDNRALVFALVVLGLLAGCVSLLTHPSREDPAIIIRTAQVVADFPGMSSERVENLITTPLEEKIREIPEVKTIDSISSTGESLIKITLWDEYDETAAIWTNLRNKMRDIAAANLR